MRILTAVAVLVVASLLAFSAGPVSAEGWCGFHQKAGAQVHCGYSTEQACKQALSDKKAGNKDVTCIPDPANT